MLGLPCVLGSKAPLIAKLPLRVRLPLRGRLPIMVKLSLIENGRRARYWRIFQDPRHGNKGTRPLVKLYQLINSLFISLVSPSLFSTCEITVACEIVAGCCQVPVEPLINLRDGRVSSGETLACRRRSSGLNNLLRRLSRPCHLAGERARQQAREQAKA